MSEFALAEVGAGNVYSGVSSHSLADALGALAFQRLRGSARHGTPSPTHEVITVANTTYINSESMVGVLRQLAAPPLPWS